MTRLLRGVRQRRTPGRLRPGGWRFTSTVVGLLTVGVLTPILNAPASALGNNATTLQLSSATIVPGQTVYGTIQVTESGLQPYNVTVDYRATGDLQVAPPSPCHTNNFGQCYIQITIPANSTAYGPQTVSATATFIDGSSATGSANLTEYDAPKSMTLALSPLLATSQQADGISPTAATAALKDAQGRRVAGEPVTFSTNDSGIAVGPVTDHGDGTYTSNLSAPPPNATVSSFSDTVSAALSSAGLSASGTVNYTNPAPRVSGPLSAPGTQILDKGGTPVVLRGVNAGNYIVNAQSSTDPTGFYGSSNPGMLRPAAVGNLYLWGANFVRLTMTSDLYLQNCPGEAYPVTKSQYAADLQKEVNLITSYGMVALLDLHLTNPNCHWAPASFGGYGVAAPLPSKVDATAFFAGLASQFANNNLVAYELYNEPWVCGSGSPQTDTSSLGGCSQDAANHGWAQDGTLTFNDSNGQAVTYLAAGMTTIYNAVRQNAPSQLVFVDANRFAGDNGSFDTVCATAKPGCLWPGPTNLVYVFHSYECQDQSGNKPLTLAVCSGPTPEKSSTISGDLAWMLADHANGGAAWPAPVHFDEFGWPQNEAKYQYNVSTPAGQVPMQITPYGHGLFVNNAVTYLDSRGIGWALFAWGNDSDPVWQGPFTIESTTNTVPWTPNADGQPAVNSMQGKPMAYQDPPAGYG